MSHYLSRAAHRWVHGYEDLMADVTVSIVDGAVAASRRTAVPHQLAEAAELTLNDQTVLVAIWVCGGSSVDAVLLDGDIGVDCLNCRLAAQLPKRPCVYYAWDENDTLLYVGSSVSIVARVRGHMTQTPWWREVRRLTFDEYDTEFDVRRAEFEAIAERPGKHNREGVPRPLRAIAPLGFEIGAGA